MTWKPRWRLIFYYYTNKEMTKKDIKYMIENIDMIKWIINEVLDSEDERSDDENFFAVLDRLDTVKDILTNNQ